MSLDRVPKQPFVDPVGNAPNDLLVLLAGSHGFRTTPPGPHRSSVMTIPRQRILAGLAVLLASAALTAALSTPLYGMMINESLDASKFGTVNQKDTICAALGCGPTAAVNSFVYLQNMFPDVYQNPLVPAGQGIAVADLLSGKTLMNTGNQGTPLGDFILGKMAYIESQAQRVTKYEAQMSTQWEAPPGHPNEAKKPSFLSDNTFPTVAFLATELKAKEDVEILVQRRVGGAGHYVTVTGLMFDTDSGMGKISYVDPNDPVLANGTVKVSESAITRGPEGNRPIVLTDLIIDGSVTNIIGAVAESPVPEPTTLLLWGTTVAGLALARWRQARRKQQQ